MGEGYESTPNGYNDLPADRERCAEKILPFSWASWDMIDTMVIQFNDVVWTSEFGCFAAGEEIDYLVVDYSEGKATVYDADGRIGKSQPFLCVVRGDS